MIIDLGDGEFAIGSHIIDGVSCVVITPLGPNINGIKVGDKLYNDNSPFSTLDELIENSIVIAIHTMESGNVLLNSVFRAMAIQSQLLVNDEIEQAFQS